jgi:hypothetical protein
VVSPVDGLISRLENLRTIREKQTHVGVWQARARPVTRCYVEDLLARNEEKAATRAATDILDASIQPIGLSAFRNYEIDALESIPVEDFQTKAFRERQWPRSVKRIKDLRTLTGQETGNVRPPQRSLPHRQSHSSAVD